MSSNPYEQPDFYASALNAGRHRAIVGGRWDETGRLAMAGLRDAGLTPQDVLLDIGAGALRLGCKAIPYLEPGHYWATDASRELMLAGYRHELADPARLDPAQLVQDSAFAFPGIPDTITHAIAFAVFPHLPGDSLQRALASLQRFPSLQAFLFTVFLAPDPLAASGPYRQADGVVTHPDRAPYHLLARDLHDLAGANGWTLSASPMMLPRGQILFDARRHADRG